MRCLKEDVKAHHQALKKYLDNRFNREYSFDVREERGENVLYIEGVEPGKTCKELLEEVSEAVYSKNIELDAYCAVMERKDFDYILNIPSEQL